MSFLHVFNLVHSLRKLPAYAIKANTIALMVPTLVLLGCSREAPAAIFVMDNHGDGNIGGFAGDFQLFSEWRIGGEAGQGFAMQNQIDNSSSSGRIVLNTDHSTVSYEGLQISSYSNVTRVRRWSVPDGFNPDKVFTLRSDLNRIDIFAQTNDRVLPVQKVSPSSATTDGVTLADFEPIIVRFGGSFTLEGPTESISDNFSGIGTLGTGHVNFDPYGSTVSLDRDLSGTIESASIFTRIWFEFEDIQLIDTTLDGVPIDLRLTSAVANHRIESGAVAIPEPTSCAFLVISAFPCIIAMRRRR